MDQTDKKLITYIQAGFPVCARPYAAVGEKLGLSEDEVIERLRTIKDSGEIRRMGASFDSRKLGYSSTLCAVHVPAGKLDAAIAAVNSYHNVTHNYERNHHYNMWFTVIAPSKEHINEILQEIEEQAGVGPIINLPAIKLFKIQVDLPVIDG
ncbi:MAG: AsnC family transcriptional regulator [Thermoleophilia bacterium]|jgi:DNA-binding Lrp family transcriptional regulator